MFPSNEIEINISDNEFVNCIKCSTYRKNIKDWMKHLVEFHPIPKKWMSDKIDVNCSTPYTIVTESRKKRKRDSTPRPLNSFMIFSRHLRRVVLMFFTDASNSELSKLLGKFWSTLPINTKSLYDSEAKRLAFLHSKEFPDYKYRPQKKKKTVINNIIFNQSNITKTTYDKTVQNTISDWPVINPEMFSFKKEKSVDGFAYSQLPFSVSDNAPINKTYNCRKITISNLAVDEFNDTESSASSSRLPSKTEIFQSISPTSEQSFESLSEQNFSPSVPKSGEYDNHSDLQLISRKLSPIFNCNRDFPIELYIKTEDNRPETTLPFTRPLSIITESVNYRKVYIPTNGNNKVEYRVRTTESVNYRRKPQNNYQIISKGTNESKIRHNSSKTTNIIPKLEPVHNCQEILSLKPDPLIIDDVCKNDHFIGESFSLENDYSNHNSSWPLQSSPNYKLSTISSTSSSGNNCREIYGSPSPFLLSENDQNSIQIQKLPAIGSWLRSNYSEYTI